MVDGNAAVDAARGVEVGGGFPGGSGAFGCFFSVLAEYNLSGHAGLLYMLLLEASGGVVGVPIAPGDRLIMSYLNISRHVLRSACGMLVREGFISYTPGEGRSHSTVYRLLRVPDGQGGFVRAEADRVADGELAALDAALVAAFSRPLDEGGLVGDGPGVADRPRRGGPGASGRVRAVGDVARAGVAARDAHRSAPRAVGDRAGGDASAPAGGGDAADVLPLETVVALYHSCCPDLKPLVPLGEMDAAARGLLAAWVRDGQRRLLALEGPGLLGATWLEGRLRAYFERLNSMPFMRGGGARGWVAYFQWIFDPSKGTLERLHSGRIYASSPRRGESAGWEGARAADPGGWTGRNTNPIVIIP